MKKLLVAGAAVLTAGALIYGTALATDGDSSVDSSSMMGGDCVMLGMMGHGMMGKGRMRHGRMHRGRRMHAMAEGRLAYLKAELDITKDQEAAWDVYAEAVKDRAATMQGMHQTMMALMDDGSAIDRMEARITGMEAMLESMKAVKPATEALYAVLSKGQKEKADDLIGMGCGAM